MNDAGRDDLLGGAIAAIEATLRTGRRPPLPPELAGNTELRRITDELVTLYGFLLAVSNGDLEPALDARGSVAGALKNLQASLRHLTWQTQRVAEGDFSQRVDFMGEFSEAFNAMVAALAQARADLAERNEQLLAQSVKLEALATHDALTGLYNRHKFNELITMELESAKRYDRPFSLIVVDIDHFKRVNDTLGHEAGDQVLVAVATLLHESVRVVDSLARWGGEEFVALLPEVAAGGATKLAERLRRTVKERMFAGGVTVSCGVAEHRPPESPDGLFARADSALYRAKERGRDRVEVAD